MPDIQGPLAEPGPAGPGAAATANEADRGASREPVVVLSYAHAGSEALIRLLSTSPSLVCTSATGLLPLCHSAARVWQQVEGNSGTASTLATTSVRNLAGTLATALKSKTGAIRWCETAYASAEAAETFLRIFPRTTFFLVHRSLPGVLAEAAENYPWGLGGSPFWPYTAPYPGNDAAAIAAYWAECTDRLLGFEAANPDAGLRLRHEDLAQDARRVAPLVFARLGLPGTTPNPNDPGDRRDAADRGAAEPGRSVNGPRIPTDRLPPQLLAKVRELHAKLDYDCP